MHRVAPPDGVVDAHAQMWIDRRGNWHIIGHAYNTAEVTHCARSALSTHFFSRDGRSWQLITGAEPYGHTVRFSDGTSQTFSTLEQVNVHFDTAGQMTHLAFAAPATGDEGCANRTWWVTHRKPTPCCGCKYQDRTHTVVVALRTTKNDDDDASQAKVGTDSGRPVRFLPPTIVSLHGGDGAEQAKVQWHHGRNPESFMEVRRPQRRAADPDDEPLVIIGQLGFNCNTPCAPKAKQLPIVFSATAMSRREPFTAPFKPLWDNVTFGGHAIQPQSDGSLLGFGAGIPKHAAVGPAASQQWLVNASSKGFDIFGNSTVSCRYITAIWAAFFSRSHLDRASIRTPCTNSASRTRRHPGRP